MSIGAWSVKYDNFADVDLFFVVKIFYKLFI